MRKSFKKGLAMVLAAAMVFSTPVAVNKTVAGAAETQLPQAVYSYDFEGESALQSKGTATGAESAITLVKDKGTVEVVKDGENSVLRVSDGGTESFGKNYAKLPADLFKGVTAENGLTLSMKVKIDKEKNSEWSTIFSSTPAKYDEWNLFKTNANLATDVNGGDPQAYGGAGTAGTDHFGAWHAVTVTVTKDKITTYLDGIEKMSGTVSADSPAGKAEGVGFSSMLAQIAKNQFNVLGCGGFPGEKLDDEKTGDKDISEILYDDIQVYTSALNASQIYKVATGKDAEANGFLSDSIKAELNADGTGIDLKYETKLPVDPANMTIKVNDVEVATGSAVSVATASGETKTVSGSAVYAYTPDADGEIKFTVSVAEQTIDGKLYLAQEKTVTLKVKKEGEKYLYDADLYEGFSVEEGSEGYNITWKALNEAAVKVVVTGDGKTITLDQPRTIKFAEIKAGVKYTVTLTATKANHVTKTATKDFTYSTKFEPYTVGTTDKKTPWWTLSKPYQINDKKTRVVDLEVHGGTKVYNNFVLAFANQEDFNEKTRGTAYTEYAVVRTDLFGWGGGDHKSLSGDPITYVSHSLVSDGKTLKQGDADFEKAFIALMDSANANVEISRNGKMLEINLKVVSTKNAKNVFTSKTTLTLGSKDGKDNGLGKVYMRLGADGSYFIVKNVTEKDYTGQIQQPNVNDPNTSTAKVSKVTIKVPNKKSGKTIYMKVKDKLTLKATVTGTGKYSKSVTWSSSKKKVASVTSKGKVTAKKAGTAKITATSKTDKKKKATITIKVSKKAVKNKALKLKAAKKTLKKGKTYTIGIKKITKKTTEKITYKSSKKSVATVDAYGVVKAKKKGKANITVKCGKKKATLKLTVK